MIKILYALNGVFHKGGTEAVVLNILKFIDKSMFEIEFLVHGDVNKNNEIHDQILKQGVKIHFVTPRNVSYIKNIADVKRVLQNNDYSIVHSHMDAAGYFVLKEAKKQNIQVLIAHSHNSGVDISGNNLKQFLHKMVLDYSKYKLRKIADYYVSCSDLAGRWLFGEDICNSDSYMMFRNAIDVDFHKFNKSAREEYRNKLQFTGKYIVGHIGRFEEQKNHTFLLDIFEEILKLKPNSELMLVGEGSLLNDIKAKVYKQGIEDKVMFMGSRNDINELMSTMDIMLFPSLYEGLPVTLVEAQANGLKVVSSDNISKDTVLTNDIMLISTNRSPDEWAKYVIDFTSDEMHSDNVALLQEKGFDMSTNVKNLETIYKNLLIKNTKI